MRDKESKSGVWSYGDSPRESYGDSPRETLIFQAICGCVPSQAWEDCKAGLTFCAMFESLKS